MRADKASLAMHLLKGIAGIEGITEESFTHWMVNVTPYLRISSFKDLVSSLHFCID